MRLYDYGDDGSLPSTTRVQLFMNSIVRTQRDLARLQGEIRQMVAADPSLKKYVTEAFKTSPRLIVDNDPPRQTRFRPRKLRGNDDFENRPHHGSGWSPRRSDDEG